MHFGAKCFIVILIFETSDAFWFPGFDFHAGYNSQKNFGSGYGGGGGHRNRQGGYRRGDDDDYYGFQEQRHNKYNSDNFDDYEERAQGQLDRYRQRGRDRGDRDRDREDVHPVRSQLDDIKSQRHQQNHDKDGSLDFRINFPPSSSSLSSRTNLNSNSDNNDNKFASLMCPLPSGPRDTSVFIQKCLFPLESESNDCSSRGNSIPPETTAITSCKAPHYYSDTGDVILEVCRDGKWTSVGKSLTCKSLNGLVTSEFSLPSTSTSTLIVTDNSSASTSLRSGFVLPTVPVSRSLSCPSLQSKPGVILECITKSPGGASSSNNGGNYGVSVNGCEGPQFPGTEATYRCQTYYEQFWAGGRGLQRVCKENGVWTGSDDNFGCRLECGKSNPTSGIASPLITFGEMTILGEWPWHAALFIRDSHRDLMTNACGGTLITQKAILTAAHCVNLYLSSLVRSLVDVRVDLGRYRREKDDPYVQKMQVEKMVSHPAYNPLNFESDIAVVILKEPAKIGFHVRPICFPRGNNNNAESPADGTYATVVGWGIDENRESPDELRAAKLKVVSYEECLESFHEADANAYLARSTTFCAGNKNGTNVCRGDSGSGAYFPVTTSSGATRWVLHGIVSLGINISAKDKMCDPEKVSIFTRVGPYTDWILKILVENDAF